jgi:hypothetical protein
MTSKKTEPPLRLDMDFGEAMKRFARTRPDEVQPPPGRKPKSAKNAGARDGQTVAPDK